MATFDLLHLPGRVAGDLRPLRCVGRPVHAGVFSWRSVCTHVWSAGLVCGGMLLSRKCFFVGLLGTFFWIAAIAGAWCQQPGPQSHDMLLLLPDGPLHLRIDVTDNGKSLLQLRNEFMERLVSSLDTDSNGKISRQETKKHPLFVSGRRFTENKFLDSLRARKDYSDRELSMAVERAAGQLVAYRQNSSSTDQDLSVFRVLDENESGLIERVEMRTAAARLAERDLDFDQCITFDEFLSESSLDMMNQMVSMTEDEPPKSVRSELLRDATEKILPPRLVRRYDSDRDAKLSAQELGWSQAACAELDRDGDQLLNMQELAGLASAEPDLWLAIDLGRSDQESLTIVSGRLVDSARVPGSDVVELSRAGASLSISYRQRDPLEEADRNARTAFNAIDVDTNGYLDREEIVDHQRFERYLFDAMDADEDDRVFAEEMLTYVQAYTEPASTSCQVTLFDTGNGYFSMLDGNADGRIAIRELRQVEDRLFAASDGEGVLNPSRQTKSFRIEIRRGGTSLFGRVDRPEAETPTVSLQTSVGPIWFRRMDRNSDGDLVWDEFLGPRDVFHNMDLDRDGLIDPQEAADYRHDP